MKLPSGFAFRPAAVSTLCCSEARSASCNGPGRGIACRFGLRSGQRGTARSTCLLRNFRLSHSASLADFCLLRTNSADDCFADSSGCAACSVHAFSLLHYIAVWGVWWQKNWNCLNPWGGSQPSGSAKAQATSIGSKIKPAQASTSAQVEDAITAEHEYAFPLRVGSR